MRAGPRAESRSTALFAALVTICLAPAAAADPLDKERAERLFVEGRAALDRGNHPEACAKFESSLALAEKANTLFNVAQCEERAGRLVVALQRWNRGIALIGDDAERAAAPRERAEALDKRLPRITIALAGNVPPGTRVRADGVLLESSALAAPLLLDPGEHRLVVHSPGRRDQRVHVQLAEGERKEIVVVPGPLDPGPAVQENGEKTLPPPLPRVETDGRRTAGFVIGGLGIAGLAAAAITGGLLVSRNETIQEHCPEGRCDPEGRETIDSSGPLLVANAITWGVGLAGVGVGAALILSSGGEQAPKAAVAPTALPGGGGIALIGRF